MSKLKGDVLSGIEGISKVYIDENFLETDGSSLQAALVHEAFDATKCVTNDITEVLEVLGIEAARKMLYMEIKKVLEFDGTYINDRHFITLVDVMTSKGCLMAITRHGINRGDNGPLMKCSFEETIDVLTDSAVFAEKDMLHGVTENITVGKLANMGTGSFDLLYDYKIDDEQYDYRPVSSCSYNQYEQSYISDTDDEFEQSEI
jgi:DNA-directed RNA polymerase II subunit RPB1